MNVRHTQWLLMLLIGLLVGANDFTRLWAADADDTFQLGVQAYRRGEYAQAIDLLRRARHREPQNPDIHYYLAISLDKLSFREESLREYGYVVDHGTDVRVVEYSKSRLKSLQGSLSGVATRSEAREASGKSAANREVSREVSIVPLKKSTQALMVEATLNNGISGTFILDTGATYTSISREMAHSLGLDLENADRVTITTANGRIEVPKVVIDRLSVNGLEARNVEATVIEVRKGSSFSGLLGLSFIKKFKLTIDPSAGQLIFQEN